MTQVQPWWQRLMVVENDGSFLRNLSVVAHSYLELTNGNVVRADGSGSEVPAS